MIKRFKIRRPFLCLALLACTASTFAAIPPVEKILPNDTLFVFSVPDCAQMRGILERSPQNRLWNDPAMKPFRDKFMIKWREEFIEPLERELGVKLTDYMALLQGQLAFAVTQNGWTGQNDAQPGKLLLLDAKDKSSQLQTNLATLRRKWTDAGKPVRSETIRGVEFSIVTLSSNDTPATISKFFPQKQEIQELGREPEKPSSRRNQLVIGQFESLLILGNAVPPVERVMAQLTGGSAPALADEPAFEQNRLTLFRASSAFAWVNGKRIVDALAKTPRTEPNPQAPSPLVLPDVQDVLNGLGLNGLRTLALAVRNEPGGMFVELFIGVPDANRTGLFSLLAPGAKESGPPAFVPADAVKFQRWRLDGSKTVATVEKLLSEVSPQFLNTWNFLIESGELAVRQTNPDYDLRKTVFGNLGDDLITYEKPPRSDSPAELAAPPSLFALGSPNADALARALAGVLVIRSADALHPETREFLGRQIYSVRLPAIGASGASTLHYTAANGYVAFSKDPAMLEEFIRSAESPARPLREMAGFADAAQRVGGQGTGIFSFENGAESMRLTFERLKKNPAPAGRGPISTHPLTEALPIARPEKSFQEWMDFSLLPEFAKVAQYFHFSVWTGSANTDGVSFKYFAPAPPGAKP